jgi:signal transduction histidine kinase
VIVRAKSSLFLVGLLLILLPVLAVLQYRWIGEVSAAERDRLESSLRVASDRFAIDFDAELSRLASAFQIRDGFPDGASAIADRYQAWMETNAYPRLVRALYVMKISADSNDDASFYKVDWMSRQLRPEPLPKALEGLRDRFRPGPILDAVDDTMMIVTPIFRPGRAFVGPRQDDFRQPRSDDFRRRGEGGPALVPSSNPGGGPGPGPGPIDGAAVIELDREVILKEVIPALAEKHFSSHDETAYRLAVVTQGVRPQVVYSSAGEWTAEDIATPDKEVSLLGGPRPAIGGPRGRGPGPRNQMSIISQPWQLVIKHRSGSLERAIEQKQTRDLALAFGILLVLGAGLITVVISSQRARTLGKLQVEFAAGVSHELRTPLAVIRSAAYNLRSGIVRDKEGVEEYAKIVQEEARRLSDMVEEVLLYSETQSGRKKYKLEPVDVNEVIDRAITNLSPTVDFTQCDLTTRIDPDLPPLKADAAALTQCVQNLLSNAFKYAKGNGKMQLEIEARKDARSNEVRLSVMDDGPGIHSTDQRQLFEPFYRGRNIASNVPGNGLGLHLVKCIMQAQGGRVTFTSAPQGGASFTLHIPVAS